MMLLQNDALLLVSANPLLALFFHTILQRQTKLTQKSISSNFPFSSASRFRHLDLLYPRLLRSLAAMVPMPQNTLDLSIWADNLEYQALDCSILVSKNYKLIWILQQFHEKTIFFRKKYKTC